MAPFVFIAGLLIGVAYVLHTVIAINAAATGGSVRRRAHLAMRSLVVSLRWCWSAALRGPAADGRRVDINEFSLNAFYRNRLVRCYLGATRDRAGERNPQNFTGFDDDDDLPLADLADRMASTARCTSSTARSTSADRAIWRCTPGTARRSRCRRCTAAAPTSRGDQHGERREELGYIATARLRRHRDGGPTLGQAISVSGAAASPNMGYHTSPVVAFLLTVFNVRLGWWFPNPGKAADGSLVAALQPAVTCARSCSAAPTTSRRS